MSSIGNISFTLPGGKYVNATGKSQYALPFASYISEAIVRAHLALGTSAFFSWWRH